MLTRRNFHGGLASMAFGGLALAGCSKLAILPDAIARAPGFRRGDNRTDPILGDLVPDLHSERLLDLAEGLTYDAISCCGEPLDGGGVVPDSADGMGSFALPGGRVALVRNHEIDAADFGKSAFPDAPPGPIEAWDRLHGRPLAGGTTTIVYDYVNHRFVRHYLSLAGTVRNCAGGATPWGTWLSCEENFSRGRQSDDRCHGWVFEVPADHGRLVRPEPLRDMGRFNHEAAAILPGEKKIVYLTEDRRDGLFYRFLPRVPGKLAEGGRLQALALAGRFEGADARNWTKPGIPVGTPMPVRWIDLEEVHCPDGDDLRKRGHQAGATRFADGEGIHYGHGEFYFCVTSGGAIKSGQIMRYRPSPSEGEGEALEQASPPTLELFLESSDPATFNFGDNLTVAPNGHLVVCEDPYWGGRKTFLPRMVDGSAPCFLRGVTPAGIVYDVARLHGGSELAGACFAPDGRTLFVNVMNPAKTLAIRATKGGRWDAGGPWGTPLPGWEIYPAQASV